MSPLPTQSKRGFYHFGSSWYAPHIDNDTAPLDEVNFGIYAEDGGTLGEMQIKWEILSGSPVCQISAFDDAWLALSQFADVIDRVAELDRSGWEKGRPFWSGDRLPVPLPSQVIERLRACGVADMTRHERPSHLPADPPHVPATDLDAHFRDRLRRAAPAAWVQVVNR